MFLSVLTGNVDAKISQSGLAFLSHKRTMNVSQGYTTSQEDTRMNLGLLRMSKTG